MVIANHHAARLAGLPVLLRQVPRQPLRRLQNHQVVHAVVTRAHRAAQARGSERQPLPEDFPQLHGIPCLEQCGNNESGVGVRVDAYVLPRRFEQGVGDRRGGWRRRNRRRIRWCWC